MITYPEYSKPAAASLGCKMVSIDIGGGMTFQGPATPAQQAKLAGLAASIAQDNEELMGKMPTAIAEAEAKQKAAAEARKAKATTTPKATGTSQKGR